MDPVKLGIFTNTPGPVPPREDDIITKLPTVHRMYPEDKTSYPDVQRIQALLQVEIMIPLGPNFSADSGWDGLFGYSTEAAVRDPEERNKGLTKADYSAARGPEKDE